MGGSVWGLRIVRGAVKEGEGGNVVVYKEDFSEEIGGGDEAGKEDKAEKLLADPLLQPSANQDACQSTWTYSG